MYQLRFAFEETGSSKSASFLVNTNLHKQRWDARFCSDYTEILVSTERGGGRLHKTSLVSLKGLNPSRTVMKRIASSHRELDLQRPYLMPSEKVHFFFFNDHTTFNGQSSSHWTPSASIPVTFSAQSVKMSIFINILQSRSNRVRSQLPGHPSGRCKPASNRFDSEAVT